MFFQTGMTVFSAIFELFLISFGAGILVRRQMVTSSQVEVLATLTVNIFLPCLIISKIISQFHPEAFANWWMLPIAGICLIATGLVFSALLFRFNPQKMPLMILASIQNGVYIILPIGQVLFKENFDTFALYSFLLVLGLNPIMWSLGKVMLSGDMTHGIHLKDFTTPPFVVTLLSLFFVLTGLSQLIPEPVIASINLLGQATVPLAIFILGANIGAISFNRMPPIGDILIVSLVKFILIPISAFTVLYWGGFHLTMPLFGAMVMIQATSPPAANLVLIAQNYGGDTQTVSSVTLVQYIICIVIMPIWIATWQYVTK